MQKTILVSLLKEIIQKTLREFKDESQSANLGLTGTAGERVLSQEQVNHLEDILETFGIRAETVIQPTIPTQAAEEAKTAQQQQQQQEAATDTTTSSTTSSGGIVPKTEKTKPAAKKAKTYKLAITPEAVELAKQFFEAGKDGKDWYTSTHTFLKEGFKGDEQDMALFCLLLAATSPQNRVYINFLEAAAAFNAIKQDMKENPVLLRTFAFDEAFQVGGTQPPLEKRPYGQLNLSASALKIRMSKIGTKFSNIQRILRPYLDGTLTIETAKQQLVNSLKPIKGQKVAFEKRSPLLSFLKVANYGLTLLDPTFANSDENWFNVVIDTWVIRIFYPRYFSKDAPKEKTEGLLSKVMSSERAYLGLAKKISELAREAGVSPHEFQASIWLGIKRTWETTSSVEKEGTYLESIRTMIEEYSDFWQETNGEIPGLVEILGRLDTDTVARYVYDRNARRMRMDVVPASIRAREQRKLEAQRKAEDLAARKLARTKKV